MQKHIAINAAKSFLSAARPGGYEGRKEFMTERTKRYAEHYGIYSRLQELEKDLLSISGIPDVDFSVDNFDEIPQVIVIPHYVIDPTADNYYSVRKEQLINILNTCAQHDLHSSGDVIEDMGEHWYIVRRIGKTWSFEW